MQKNEKADNLEIPENFPSVEDLILSIDKKLNLNTVVIHIKAVLKNEETKQNLPEDDINSIVEIRTIFSEYHQKETPTPTDLVSLKSALNSGKIYKKFWDIILNKCEQTENTLLLKGLCSKPTKINKKKLTQGATAILLTVALITGGAALAIKKNLIPNPLASDKNRTPSMADKINAQTNNMDLKLANQGEALNTKEANLVQQIKEKLSINNTQITTISELLKSFDSIEHSILEELSLKFGVKLKDRDNLVALFDNQEFQIQDRTDTIYHQQTEFLESQDRLNEILDGIKQNAPENLVGMAYIISQTEQLVGMYQESLQIIAALIQEESLSKALFTKAPILRLGSLDHFKTVQDGLLKFRANITEPDPLIYSDNQPVEDIAKLQSVIADKDSQIKTLTGTVESQAITIDYQDLQLVTKDQTIETLKDEKKLFSDNRELLEITREERDAAQDELKKAKETIADLTKERDKALRDFEAGGESSEALARTIDNLNRDLKTRTQERDKALLEKSALETELNLFKLAFKNTIPDARIIKLKATNNQEILAELAELKRPGLVYNAKRGIAAVENGRPITSSPKGEKGVYTFKKQDGSMFVVRMSDLPKGNGTFFIEPKDLIQILRGDQTTKKLVKN